MEFEKTIVITSGYYNPLHVGHIECFELASKLGDDHIAIINSDEQVRLKGSKVFMNQNDRKKIIGALKYVNEAIISIDKDGSQIETLKAIRKRFKDVNLIFAKGGDRNNGNIPESEICKELNIKIVDGLGPKIRASSELLKNI